VDDGRCVCTPPPAGCASGRFDARRCVCSDVRVNRLTFMSIEPGAARVAIGEVLRLVATGVFDDGTRRDVTGTVDWETTDARVVRLDGAGRVTGVAAGETDVVARTGPVTARAHLNVVAPAPDASERYEARGVWVTRWNFSSAADVRRIVDEAADAGFNMIFLQVRGVADAYYRSTIEPWAARLGGALGRDPGWDPLAVAVDAAHARGVELHAWINTFPAWTGELPPPASTPPHPLRAHPDWLVVDTQGRSPGASEGYHFISPGNADVRAHVAAVAREIVAMYAVDGLHLDYIRYPGRAYSYDDASRRAHQADGRGMTYGAWQREMVNDTVARVYAAVTDVRASVKLTAAVWGIYENVWGWPAVSQGNADYFQDSLEWMRRGTIDAVVPMIYWPPAPETGQRLDYGTLVDFFAGHAAAAGRHCYAGTHADHAAFATLEDMVLRARAANAGGTVFFAWTYLTEHGHLPAFAAAPFREAARPPPMPWKR
jgi:uncharacterized lipoprotein YddW (UPF0748 family)